MDQIMVKPFTDYKIGPRRGPVFGVSDRASFKIVSSATETS